MVGSLSAVRWCARCCILGWSAYCYVYLFGAMSIYSRSVYDVFSCATARICLRHLYGVLRGYIIKKGCFLVIKKDCAQVTDEYTHRLRQSVCADAMLLEYIQLSCLHMRRVWV